jgi:hypothetical protein
MNWYLLPPPTLYCIAFAIATTGQVLFVRRVLLNLTQVERAIKSSVKTLKSPIEAQSLHAD